MAAGMLTRPGEKGAVSPRPARRPVALLAAICTMGGLLWIVGRTVTSVFPAKGTGPEVGVTAL